MSSSAESASRQLLQRLQVYRDAGIEFLPRFEAARADPIGERTQESTATVAAGTLFTPSAPAAGLDQRRVELKLLAERVCQCTRCPELVSARTQTVFGVGAISPDICFIGEAPGADEDRQGEPFVGAAGQLLNRIIAAMGMKREEVYICNILRCRPPGNRQPKPDEARNCREFLDGQLDLVRPKFICALGATAAQNLLETRAPLGKLRGKFYVYRDIPVVCTYHPASLLPSRSPENKALVWEDMKMLLTRMGRPIPTAGKKSE
jgi:DNA polymerase